jgi:hypothetical protein
LETCGRWRRLREHRKEIKMAKIFLTDTTLTVWPGVETDGEEITVECIGGGGGGDARDDRRGGGGGEYRKSVVSYASGTSVPIHVGVAGVGSKQNTQSTPGGITEWNDYEIKAYGGYSGWMGGDGGGTFSAGIGDVGFAGGRGMSGSGVEGENGGGGGGGAGGPDGIGADGGSHKKCGGGGGGSNGGSVGIDGDNSVGGNGGNGGGGTGHGLGDTGTGATAGTLGGGGGGGIYGVLIPGADGGSDIAFDATHGCGGGGGGAGGADGGGAAGKGGDGAVYGGGGGGCDGAMENPGSNGGNGGQGLIIITYNPGPYQITRNDYFDRTQPAKSEEVKNIVRVPVSSLTVSLDKTEIYKSDSAVPIGAAGSATESVTINAEYSNYPAYVDPEIGVDVTLPSVSDPGITITEFTPYACSARVVVTNTSASSGTFTLLINGNEFKTNSDSVVEKSSAASILEYGTQKYDFPVNRLIQDSTIAGQIADLLLASYNGMKTIEGEEVALQRKDVSLDWRGDPAVELGDIVRVPEYQTPHQAPYSIDNRADFYIVKNKIDFDGTVRSTTDGRKIL